MKKVVLKILKYFFTIILILFVSMVCLQRLSNNRFTLFNFRLFIVISGSMEPKYKIGDVLVAVETDPKDVKVGDVISYLGKSGGFNDKVITHQVVKIEKDSNGKYQFHSKGLANMIEDPIVSEDQLYGVVKYRVVTLSLIYKVVGRPLGFFLFIVVPILYIIISELVLSILEKEQRRRQKQM